MTPAALLAAARDLLRRPDPATLGLWPRAAALLGRQALEGAFDALWAARAPSLQRCNARVQLLCLRTYLGDEALAERAAWAWGVLSHAAHHHAYELAPVAEELELWLDTVEDVLSAHG